MQFIIKLLRFVAFLPLILFGIMVLVTKYLVNPPDPVEKNAFDGFYYVPTPIAIVAIILALLIILPYGRARNNN